MTNNNSNRVTNLDYITGLSKINTQFVEEVIDIFLAEGPEEIRLLEKGIWERNFELVKSSAHKIRGTLRFVGLDKIIQIEVDEIEKLAAAKSNIPAMIIAFLKIKETYQKAFQELKK